MLYFLPSSLLVVINFTLLLINICLWGSLILFATPIKLLPIRGIQQLGGELILFFYRNWAVFNHKIMHLTNDLEWSIVVDGDINNQNSYLLISNHISWLDILVLTQFAAYYLPPPRFFLKDELKWVPLLGSGCWALDMIYMKRYSKKQRQQRPELQGKDIETTRKVCTKLINKPTTIINFVEGTRATAKKLIQSDFEQVLNPKAGGIAFTLATMREQFSAVLDVTLMYPYEESIFWQLLKGQAKEISLHIDVIDIKAIEIGDYYNDATYKARFCHWLNQRWQKKDRRILQYKLSKNQQQQIAINQ